MKRVYKTSFFSFDKRMVISVIFGLFLQIHYSHSMDMALERLDFAGERFLGEGRYIYHFSPKKRLGTNPELPRAICLFDLF